MIGYGKLGLLIECMKKLLLVLVLFGSLGSIAFNRLLQTHGCCTFSPTKLHFCPEFSYHSPFSRKTTLPILAYCLRKLLVQRQLRYQERYLLLIWAARKPDTIDG